MAARHLRRLGFDVVARNVRVGRAEIDIVARDALGYCFVEVKTRGPHPAAPPWAAVDGRKRRTLERAARSWLAERGETERDYGFGVVSVVVDPARRVAEIEWIDERR